MSKLRSVSEIDLEKFADNITKDKEWQLISCVKEYRVVDFCDLLSTNVHTTYVSGITFLAILTF